jgi:hypothetical protein
MMTTMEGAMNVGRVLVVLTIAQLLVLVSFSTTLAVARPDGCRRVVTTGPSFIGHDCHHDKRITRVDNRPVVNDPRRSTGSPHRERPFERLLTRGDGQIKAHGDKGARRELREKGHHQHSRGTVRNFTRNWK